MNPLSIQAILWKVFSVSQWAALNWICEWNMITSFQSSIAVFIAGSFWSQILSWIMVKVRREAGYVQAKQIPFPSSTAAANCMSHCDREPPSIHSIFLNGLPKQKGLIYIKPSAKLNIQSNQKLRDKLLTLFALKQNYIQLQSWQNTAFSKLPLVL